jgi:hypothetical protein
VPLDDRELEGNMTYPPTFLLVCITMLAGMTIPRSGTKIGDVPITVPFLLYMLMLIYRPMRSMSFKLRQRSLHEDLAVYGILGYFVVGLFSICIGILKSWATRSILIEASALVGFVPFFFLVRESIRTPQALRAMVRIVICAVALVSMYGIVQRVFGAYNVMVPGVTICYADAQIPNVFASKSNVTILGLKLVSTFQNGNLYGNFLTLTLPLCMAMAMVAKGRRRWIYGAVFLLASANLMMTLSRGAILSGIVGIWLVVLMLPITRTSFAITVTFPILAGLLLRILSLGERLLAFDPTAAGRIPAYEQLLRIYSDLPAAALVSTLSVGTGMGGIVGSLGSGMPSVESSLGIILMKMGLPGLFSFLLGIYGVTRLAVRRRSPLTEENAIACGLAAGIIGACLHFTIDSIIMYPPTAMNFWAAAALAVAASTIALDMEFKAQRH